MSERAADAPLRIRDAATILLVRRAPEGPQVLMGMRGAGAAFMPSKYVFPGGAVDVGDAAVPFAAPLNPACAARLAERAPAALAGALAAAAVRELWEETGLMLGAPGRWPGPVPRDWQGFVDAGLLPDASALTFVFRAITPPGRPRRFDARFFLADADAVHGDADDFSRACDELSHLHWVALAEARRLNLPFITEVAVAEVAALLARNGGARPRPENVPFFDNAGAHSTFRRLQ
ncbi:MAG: NUDIX hydrolase [Phaeovulum sp.]|uniref:NUDIX hydrolase n=1 Tax=Phaeovulum sp. TaxID=2934796 RepID=UPI0027333A2B|nr:NUDIX hydrolase [Phaeovulum sp.]MDP3862545.1 NUDIX hydrolase [Phaeovulum sp.]